MASLLALASAACYGAADFLGGLASRQVSTLVVVFVSQFAGLVLLAVLLPFLPGSTPSAADLAWGGAAGVAGGLGVGLLYRALVVGTMAIVAPTTAIFAVALPVMVSILLGERPPPLAVGGIVLALIAIVLISHRPAERPKDAARAPMFGRLPPGTGLAFASGLAIGVFFLALARTSPGAGMWPLLAARCCSVALCGVAVLGRRSSLRMTGHVAGIAIWGGVLDMVANALYLVASRSGPLSVVVTLASLYPASTVVLARIVLGERLDAWQGVGIVCALAAVMLIVAPAG